MYDVYSCGFDGVIVRPKRVHKQIIHIFAKDFACQRNREDPKAGLQVSEPDRWAACGGDFGGTLGSLWGQVWVSLGLVWVSVGDFG